MDSPVARLALTNGFVRDDRFESEERYVKKLSNGQEAWLRTRPRSEFDEPETLDPRDPQRHGGRDWEFLLVKPVSVCAYCNNPTKGGLCKHCKKSDTVRSYKDHQQLARGSELVMNYLLGALLQRLATWNPRVPKPKLEALGVDDPDDPETVIRQEVARRAEPIKELTIHGRRWFRRGPGTTYHSAQIFINGKLVHEIPYAYGYSDDYLWNAFRWLEKNGYIEKTENEPPWVTAEREGFKLNYDVIDVPRKRDL